MHCGHRILLCGELCRAFGAAIRRLKVFQVIRKSNQKITPVYAVRNDNHGYPHFLIHEGKHWKWLSAKHFEPMDAQKNKEET